MSRAYRIRVREMLRRVIRAEDHVSSQLELLEILPADQMADLLAQELKRRGFERDGDVVTRRDREVVVRVELDTGVVRVKAEASEKLQLKGEATGVVYEEERRNQGQAKERLRDEVLRNLEKDAEREQAALQKQITDRPTRLNAAAMRYCAIKVASASVASRFSSISFAAGPGSAA